MTRMRYPKTSSSGSTTSATRCPPSPSTSRGRALRSWRSTTTSCGWDSRATLGSTVTARDVATRLAGEIEKLGPFELLTHGDELPVFAFRLADGIDNFTVFDVSNALRERGWQVPGYTFPENRTDLGALRVVVRRGFTHDLADMLVNDLKKQLVRLEKQPEPVHDGSAAGFSH